MDNCAVHAVLPGIANFQENAEAINAHQDVETVTDLIQASQYIPERTLKSEKQLISEEMKQIIGQQ